MQQSNVIFGAILIAYLIFITGRGELASYIALLKGNGAQNPGGASGSGLSLSALGQGASLLQQGWNSLGLSGSALSSTPSVLDTSALTSFNTGGLG